MSDGVMQAPETAPAVEPLRRPGWLTGAVIGGLLTVPLLAVYWMGDQVVGLPFIPFDLFDWLATVLPGDVIRFGINIIKDLNEQLQLGPTDDVGKALEHLQALLMLVGIGVVTGAGLFSAWRRLNTGLIYLTGVGIGLLIGIFFAVISAEVNLTATTGPLTSLLWILLSFVVWGAAFAWIYDDLSDIGQQIETPAEVAAAQIDRRQFMVRVGTSTAVLTLASTGITSLLNLSDEATSSASGFEAVPLPDGLPNRSATLIPAPGTRPEYTPLDDHYRIDIVSRPPEINGESYRLKVYGMVAEERDIALTELIDGYEPVDQFVTLSCISNEVAGDLISTTRWTGVPMAQLLDDWGVSPEATYLHIRSADNFDEYVSIDLIRQDERVMLAYAWDGLPLKQKHGFPLRIYIPDRYGMKQPKWITDIEATNEKGQGFWVRRRWDDAAIVRTTSVIDTVAVNGAFEAEDGAIMIPIGGIAYSGAKGISRVEVSMDDGPWVQADLREPLSETTWVLWRYDWAFTPGEHRIAVRAYDNNERLQITERADVFPSGATGVHRVRADVPEEVEIATPTPTPTPTTTPEPSDAG